MTLKVLGDTLMDELEVGLLLDCSVALSPAISGNFRATCAIPLVMLSNSSEPLNAFLLLLSAV